MGKSINKPELIVHRCFKGEKTIYDAFANAYRIYFDEMKAKDSIHTFDPSKLVAYNEGINRKKEGDRSGTTA